jgi:hypothetical protein
MAESGSTLKGVFYTILTSVGLAVSYHFIGIDSSGNKIEQTKTTNNDMSGMGNMEEKVQNLEKKEKELKERELQIRIDELEKKLQKNNLNEEIPEYNLTGNWAGSNGFQYTINQNNNNITYTESYNFLGNQNILSSGSGILNNGQINFTGYGLLGQQFTTTGEVYNSKNMAITGFDLNGNPIKINLSRN